MGLPQKCLIIALLPRARAGHHAYDALACAAERGDATACAVLLEVARWETPVMGATPLERALQAGFVDCASFLLSKMAFSVDLLKGDAKRPSLKRRCFEAAVRSQQPKVLAWVLTSADVAVLPGRFGEHPTKLTPLVYCIVRAPPLVGVVIELLKCDVSEPSGPQRTPPLLVAMWYAGDAATEAALLGTPTHNELLAAPSSRDLYDDLSEGMRTHEEVIERVGRDRAACEAEMDQCDRNIKALQEQLDQQHTLRAKQQGLMQAHGSRARLNQRQLHELAKRRSGVLWQLRPPREVAPVWLRLLSLRDRVRCSVWSRDSKY